MKKELIVPYISQHAPYVYKAEADGNAIEFKTQIKDRNGCWYACARMLNAYFYGQCATLGAPSLMGVDRHGKPQSKKVTEQSSPELCSNELLYDIRYPPSKQWTLEFLTLQLSQHGPVMFGWRTPGGHFCVLIGTDDSNMTIKYHDPDVGPNQIMGLGELNAQFMWDEKYSMLRKKPLNARSVRGELELSPKKARAAVTAAALA